MSVWKSWLAPTLMISLPAFAQNGKGTFDFQELKGLENLKLENLNLDNLNLELKNLKLPTFEFNGDKFAFATGNPGVNFLQGKGARGGDAYEVGTRLLDERRYDDAIRRFDAVIAGKSDRADGALYWKAYALNRVGRRDDALATIASLRRDHPGSHWLNDAQALEVEIRQNTGKPISPADESNEDIKLIAINALMNAEPERALPPLEALLKGNAAPKVKDRAMFVLTQNRSPRAQQILADYAKGAGNPDLQVRAIRYIGMTGTPEAKQQLVSIYAGSTDVEVKRQILRSMMTSQGAEPLFNLAKSEKEPSLREEAIRQLGMLRATSQLSQLYTADAPQENKTQILRALMMAGDSEKLLELAKNEKNAAVREEAIRNLAMSQSVSAATLASLYSTDNDARTKKAVVNGLQMKGDAKGLIALARKETDTTMKAYIVTRLGTMRDNKEATDYMMELLK